MERMRDPLMLIREAHDHDCAAIRTLFAQVDALHAAARPEMFRPADPTDRTDTFIRGLLASQTNTLWVATSGDHVLAVAWVIIRTAPDSPVHVPRTYAVVETLVVEADARGQGIGRALMEHVQTWAVARGLSEVQLAVHEFNTDARAFYEKLGYETVERRLRRRLPGA
jgi:ribosomal protein S18 acetylase RimI-like enzyme